MDLRHFGLLAGSRVHGRRDPREARMLRALASSAQPKQALGRLLRMNSSGAKARGTLADKVALVTASTEG